MNGESSQGVSDDKAEAAQVIKPTATTPVVQPTHDEVAVSLRDAQATPPPQPEAPAPTTEPTPAAPQKVTNQEPQPTINQVSTEQTQSAPAQPPVPVELQSPWNVAEMPGQNQMMPPEDYGYQQQPMAEIPEVHWTASEFIVHEKSATWYMALAGATAILVAFAIFVVHDTVAVISIVLIALLFGVVASHKPRTLQYIVDETGVTMGRRTFPFSDFKSFGVIKEDAFSNITLVPLKRFSPPLTIYYPPEDEESIVQVIAMHLPMAPVSTDLIDGLLRRIRL